MKQFQIIENYGTETIHFGPSPLAGPAFNFALLVFFLLVTVVIIAIKSQVGGKRKILRLAMKKRSGELFLLANQIGLSAEYLAPEENRELHIRTQDFFDKLSVLDRALEESEKIKNTAIAIDAQAKCLKLTDILLTEAGLLAARLNDTTGGVNTSLSTALQNEKEMVQTTSAFAGCTYYRPTWSKEDEYAHPVVIATGGALADLMEVLNSYEPNRYLDKAPIYLNDNRLKENRSDN
ncbi:MAG: hypothetical protein IPK73_09355 [Candidatus Obscuribacter sp.]|nr:hypothetical protein [Candidatus Obscuribacter sp.]MBK9279810.1 hypothetical protein [Candidatus Obscuribacter sp.]MBL8082604.1 hypothetical protein [Candidatus Obscuribacter sp.]